MVICPYLFHHDLRFLFKIHQILNSSFSLPNHQRVPSQDFLGWVNGENVRIESTEKQTNLKKLIYKLREFSAKQFIGQSLSEKRTDDF